MVLLPLLIKVRKPRDEPIIESLKTPEQKVARLHVILDNIASSFDLRQVGRTHVPHHSDQDVAVYLEDGAGEMAEDFEEIPRGKLVVSCCRLGFHVGREKSIVCGMSPLRIALIAGSGEGIIGDKDDSGHTSGIAPSLQLALT